MAQLYILYWRDIPAQVIAQKSRREQYKKILDVRFEKAIDRAAMKSNNTDDGDYLALWRKSKPIECSDDIEQEAEQYASKIEQEYDIGKLSALVNNGGSAI